MIKPLKFATAALLLGALVSLSLPVSAQNVTNAIVIAALQAMGLFGDGYATGQVPVWDATAQMYVPGSPVPAYPLVSPSFTGQMTGAASTCAAPSYSETGNLTTGLALTATPSWILCVGGASVLTGTASAVTSTVTILAPNGTAAAPAYSFASDPTTGLYRFALGRIGWANATTLVGILDSNGISLVTTSPSISLNDAILARESAAVLQMGLDTAGVTDQMLKGPDRITSDGVGGNLTFAGGRNRGASAGGSIIFQTAPAAGVGVTGTLVTALTIDSTKVATFVGTVSTPVVQGSGTGTSVANVGANSCGTTAATIAGNQVSGVITVGATAGTQCRVTFTTVAPVARDCTVTDSTTTIATRATVVDTTNTDFLGAFVAGDKITYQCTVR